MKDIERKCNPMVNLSRFTSNKIYIYIEWNYSHWLCPIENESKVKFALLFYLCAVSLHI